MSVWSKIYERINWKDLPQRLTALAARNLNKMDLAIDTLDDRTIGLNTRLEAVEENPITVDTELKPDSENPVQNKVIYAAFEDLLPEETVQGNPISINDASGLNAKACSVDLLPIQDLHGYDSPWVGGAGKNKLKNTATSTTINGVTFTVNSDGSVRANGTASGNAILVLNSFTFDGTSVILNGCPNGGSDSTYRLDAFGASGLSADIGNGVTITTSGERNIRIVVFSGTTIDKVFYPMICLTSVTDETFAPYENICPISGRNSVEVKRTGKNLLENIATSTTINDVTFTVNADGSVTANGTASGNANFYVNGNSVKRFGQSIITGCPTGGSSTTYFLEFYDTENASYSCRDYGNGNNIQADANGDISRVVISVRSGYTASNLIFYPMIRLATETDATYEPYRGETYTENLGATYYGGKAVWNNDGTAKATIDTGYKQFTSSDVWAISGAGSAFKTIADMKILRAREKEGICSKLKTDNGVNGCAQFGSHQGANSFFIINARDFYGLDTVAKIQAFTDGMQIAYPLATPIEIDLTAEQISLLKGQNVISTDGDNIILKYSADIKAWVENQLSV